MISFLLAGNRSNSTVGQIDISSVAQIIDRLEKFSTVVLLSNDKNLEKLKHSKPNLIFQLVPDNTSGALITAAFGLSQVKLNEPFLIVPTNSGFAENLIEDFSESMVTKVVTVGAIVFEGENSVYSYARLGKMNNVIEIVEKRVEGGCALAGVYYFSDKISFEKCLRWALLNNVKTDGRFYISPALNYFLADSVEVELYEISAEGYSRLE